MKKRPVFNKQQGFTLIELLVVIAIIGLLSSLAVVSLNTSRAKARDAKRGADLRTLQSAIEIYGTESVSGKYPEAETWAEFVSALSPYISTLPVPPVLTDLYEYASISQNNSITGYILAATGFDNPGQGVLLGDLDGAAGDYEHDQGVTITGAGVVGTVNANGIACGTAGATDNIFCVGHITQ